jgi:undecaprenyl-diphosphatase
MTILQSILLGLVQGLTEFLPISSSGHLVIIPYLLGWDIPAVPAFIFDVLVQVATLVAVIAYFWKDLLGIVKGMLTDLWHRHPFQSQESRLGWLIILACVPAGLLGITIKDVVEAAFGSPLATAFFLFGTAILLFIGEKLGKRQRELEAINWIDAIWIGVFQALAIFPGLSRSGSTISGGMLRNLKRPAAARFSFLMSVPIMLAAGMLAGVDLLKLPNLGHEILVFIPGFITAAIVGYLTIRWLLGYLSRRPVYIFSIYCTVMAVLTILVYFVRR